MTLDNIVALQKYISATQQGLNWYGQNQPVLPRLQALKVDQLVLQ